MYSRVCTTEVDSSHESEYVLDIWQALKEQNLFTSGQGDNISISLNAPAIASTLLWPQNLAKWMRSSESIKRKTTPSFPPARSQQVSYLPKDGVNLIFDHL